MIESIEHKLIEEIFRREEDEQKEIRKKMKHNGLLGAVVGLAAGTIGGYVLRSECSFPQNATIDMINYSCTLAAGYGSLIGAAVFGVGSAIATSVGENGCGW